MSPVGSPVASRVASRVGSQVATLVGKEVRTLFTSPIAYAVIAVFIVLSGYTFTVSYRYDVRRTITEFTDGDGNVLREVIEAHFVGTATNDTTGKTLSVDGERHIVWDFAAGTWTETGTLRHVTVPGSGVVLLQSGRIVYPLPAVPQPDVIPKVELFMAGPHDVFEGQYADFCAALADA